MKTFVRMSSDLNIREVGGMGQGEDGDLGFGEWNCRAGGNGSAAETPRDAEENRWNRGFRGGVRSFEDRNAAWRLARIFAGSNRCSLVSHLLSRITSHHLNPYGCRTECPVDCHFAVTCVRHSQLSTLLHAFTVSNSIT